MFPVIYSRPRLDSENGDRETRTLATSMQQRCMARLYYVPYLLLFIIYIYVHTYTYTYIHIRPIGMYIYLFIYRSYIYP